MQSGKIISLSEAVLTSSCSETVNSLVKLPLHNCSCWIIEINYTVPFPKWQTTRFIKRRHKKVEIINCSSFEVLLDKEKKSKKIESLQMKRISRNLQRSNSRRVDRIISVSSLLEKCTAYVGFKVLKVQMKFLFQVIHKFPNQCISKSIM